MKVTYEEQVELHNQGIEPCPHARNICHGKLEMTAQCSLTPGMEPCNNVPYKPVNRENYADYDCPRYRSFHARKT
jgi:hypothetical protein